MTWPTSKLEENFSELELSGCSHGGKIHLKPHIAAGRSVMYLSYCKYCTTQCWAHISQRHFTCCVYSNVQGCDERLESRARLPLVQCLYCYLCAHTTSLRLTGPNWRTRNRRKGGVRRSRKNRVCLENSSKIRMIRKRKEKCVCTRAGTGWTEIKHMQTAVSHFQEVWVLLFASL